MSDQTDTRNDDVARATELTIAWLRNPNTRTSVADVPTFLATMHSAVIGLNEPFSSATTNDSEQEHVPAVSVRKSLASRDHIISLIDGKPYRTLRRHLTGHGLTPDEYRQRYGLKRDYPMVAPAYSEARSATAKAIGLGRKAGETVEKAVEGVTKVTRKSGKAALAAARNALRSED